VIDLERFTDALDCICPAECRSDVTQVLDAGCGLCPELPALMEMFPRATLALIDRDASSLGQIGQGSYANRVKAVHLNARDIAYNVQEWLDLIILRHPDVSRSPGDWGVGIHSMAMLMSAKGLLLMTTYALDEACFVDSCAADAGLKRVAGAPYTAIPVALAGNDRYIQAYQKYDR
jgi:hypothetical protein